MNGTKTLTNKIIRGLLAAALLAYLIAATVALVWTAAAQPLPQDGDDFWRLGEPQGGESC